MKGIKVIYDEASAIREKREREAVMLEQTKRTKTFNAMVLAISVLIALAVIGWIILRNEESSGVLTGGLVCVAVGLVAKCVVKREIPVFKWYSANVQYYLHKADKTVLEHNIQYDEQRNAWILWLTLEDRDHVVTEESLWMCPLTRQTRTDIEEAVVDLQKGIIYEPYET